MKCWFIVKRCTGNSDVYEILQSIRSKYIPIVYQTARKDDKYIVLEEYIDGMTVADILCGGLYEEKGMAKIINQVLSALDVLHSNNIIHRDIKPENIMIDNRGAVKLIDYNVAKIYKIYEEIDTVNLGTNGYAAPEQYGISQSDNRTDIYAIGVLMNVMLTREHPSKTIYKGAYSKVIKKCIQVNRKDRYQNVNDIKKQLHKRKFALI